jgi:hypothetical protein
VSGDGAEPGRVSAGGIRPGRVEAGGEPGVPVLRQVAAFAPMCAVAAAMWSELLARPPVGRIAAVVAIATGCGMVLALSARLEPEGRREARVVRVAAVAVSAVAVLLVAGVPPALLTPAGWGDLLAGLERGVDGLPGGDWPYYGDSFWVRETILLAIPLMAMPAAVFALWPAAAGPGGREAAAARRAGALILLLILVGVAGAERALPDPALRGAVLLLALAAWLFLPGLRAQPSAALTGGVAVLVAGLVSLPIAAALEPARPWVDRSTPERKSEAREAGGQRERSVAWSEPRRSQRVRSRDRADERSESTQSPRGERSEGSAGGRREQRESARGGGAGSGRESSQRRAPTGAAREEGPPVGLLVLLAVAVALAVGLLIRRRLRRRARRRPDDEASELRRALGRLGWSVPPQTTLSVLERRLAAAAGPAAARYARRLRERRFGSPGARPSSPLDRRALRRDLTAGHGPIFRVRGLVALPPAALRPRR